MSLAPRHPFHQRPTADGPRAHRRVQKLRRDKVKRRTAHAIQPPCPLTYTAIVHALTMPNPKTCRLIYF